MSTDGFTLAALLGYPGLNLAAGNPAVIDQQLSRSISNAQVLESNAPITGVARDDVVLTSGHGLAEPAAQGPFVDELVAARVAALGLRLGPVWAEVPASLLEYCTARQLAVLLVPPQTPLSRIVAVVHHETEGPGTHFANRLLAVQFALVDALNDADPTLAVLNRASRTVQAAFAVLRHDGQVESSVKAMPVQLLWRQIANDIAPVIELRSEGWTGVAVRMGEGEDGPARWLVAASRRAGFPDALSRAVVRMAASLISAVGRIDELSVTQARAVRSAVLTEALQNTATVSPDGLASRAAALGVDFTTAARLFVVVPGDDPGSDRAALERSLHRAEARMAERGLACLITASEDMLVVLAQGPPRALRSFIGEYLTQHPGAFIGVGRQIADISAVSTSYRDATLAAQYLRRADTGTRLMSYEDFDFSMLVLAHAGLDRILPSAQSFLAPVTSQPLLIEALEAYFEHDFDVMKAAKAMHLHHNTVRYRISRIEAALGVSLRSPAAAAAVYLALAVLAVERATTRRVTPGALNRIEQTASGPAAGIENAAGMDDGVDHVFGATNPFDA